MIIDSHVHRYPESIHGNFREWGLSRKENHWVDLVSSPLQGWPSDKQFFKDMDVAGVSKAVLLGWYWEHQETCNWHNEYLVNCMNEMPERFIAFGSVQPRDGKVAIEGVKKAIDLGIKGIGEIFPAAQGFSMKDPIWLQVVELAIEHGLPINMHVTDPVGHDYKGRVESDLKDYVWLAKEYPELKLILAHWGGLLPVYELNFNIKENLKNVYYDTSASPLLYDDKVFKLMINCVGSEKILLGSDYPLRLYPKEQSPADFSTFLQEIDGLGLGQEDKDSIFHRNAQRLFS